MSVAALLLALQVIPPAKLAEVLPPGPHPVGFSQAWLIDSTRRLPGGERYGLRFRPVLMNLWYPAAAAGGTPMRYRDYLDGAVAAAPPAIRSYATALLAHQWRTVWDEMAGAPSDSLGGAHRDRVNRFLDGAIRPRRGPPRRPAKRGLIFYVQGAGSSYDDNVLLAEFLASRGYLVVGSAFPEEGGTRFSTNASDDSRPRDIRRLVIQMHRRLGGDPGPVMVIGHSAGAQAGFLMLTDPSAPIDALLSLDTTQDYAGLSDRSWAYFTDRAVAARAGIKVPILFAAGPGALFELADSLAASPRTLMTVPEIGHNDYISQGVLRRHLAADSTRAAAREAATRGYRALAEYLGRWIDAVVAGAAAPATATSGLVVSTVGPGVRGPSAEEPRTARHLRHLFATVPPAGFADAFLSMRRADPEVGSSQVLMMLAVDAARRGDTARAKAALGAVRQRDSAAAAVDRIIEDRAKLFESIGAADLAREWFGLLRLLKGN